MITAQLLVTLGGHAFSALLLLLAGLFVLSRDTDKPLYRYYAFLALSMCAFEVGFVLAPLMPTYELAYKVWFFNIVDLLIPIAASLFFLELIGILKKHMWYIWSLVVVALGIFLTAIFYPSLFLPQVLPKLYFPWYLDGGPLYVVMLVFFFSALGYTSLRMFIEYLKTKRKDLEYFLVMFSLATVIGPINFFLVFDIPIDPLYGAGLGLSILPLAYGIVTDNLLDIRIVLKRALLYSTIIGFTTGALMLLIFLNDLLVQSIPWVRFWTIPLFAGFGSFFVGYMFWRNAVESERIKYEFVTVATHKLRTPLTQISWGVKALKEEALSDASVQVIDRIEHANVRLIELTNIIFESTQKNTSGYAYRKDSLDLVAITQTVLPSFKNISDGKNISITVKTTGPVEAVGDIRRIRSIVEVLIENAISYSPEGSKIEINIYTKGNRAHFSITDEGIGVSSEERSRIFTRFYRSDSAKRADTEGVGLGLAMSKNIIEAHKGKIGVESEGEGKGSVFWFYIPIK